MIRPLRTYLDLFRDLSEGWYELLLGKPSMFLGFQWRKVLAMFHAIPAAPAATIYSGVLWVIPLAMAGQYASLYGVNALHLSNVEIGLYQSLAKFLGPLALFVGGYLCDVWGRKKSLVLFDSLTWGGYCLSLALARNKWWAIAAIFFMAANQASGPAYQCLLVEGTRPPTRSQAYTVNQIVNLVPFLLFLPLAGGYWVYREGLSEANHQMYWFFTLMVTVGVLLRMRFIPNSGVYERSPERWSQVFRDALDQYWETFRKFFRKRSAGLFLASKCIDEWILFMWTTYASLYFVNHMGLKTTAVSVVVQAVYYVVLAVLLFLMPHVTGKRMLNILGWEQFIGVAALIPLLSWDRWGGSVFWACLFSASLAAIGTVFYNSNSAAVWMNIITDKQRAKVVVVSGTLVSIILAITGCGGSLLYGAWAPTMLIWAMAALRIVNFFLLRRVAWLLTSAH